MTVWFARGIRRGVVTIRYPRDPEPTTTGLPAPPRFRADRLDADLADRLAEACPSQALRHEPGVLVFDIGACTACERCLPVAGAAAQPGDTIELAATSRADLIKRVPLAGERIAPDSIGEVSE